jgi:tetratricopeptide (TPR) repeat protein
VQFAIATGKFLPARCIMGLCLALSPLLTGAAEPGTQPAVRPHGAMLIVPRQPDARLPVEIRRVDMDARVVGLTAQTRVELEFFNPNARDLEGELQFPLLPEQTVTGFALDIAGEMRPAVPVEKAKARQVFDDVTRAKVDPALLENTGGDNYKLRVYPLPARGSRRVALELTQPLHLGARAHAGLPAAAFTLPVAFNAPVKRLDISVHVTHYKGAMAEWNHSSVAPLAVKPQADGSATLQLSRDNYQGRGDLTLHISVPREEATTLVQSFNNATYFYAEVPISARAQPRKLPANVAIVWDASGSGSQRDAARELRFLDAFFHQVPNTQVQLRVVRDAAEPLRQFHVTGGDWRALREALQTIAYDGATRLDHMTVPGGAELALLFSDGMGNYGEGDLPDSSVALYAVQSAAGADVTRLRHAAQKTGGAVLNLIGQDPDLAARETLRARTRVVGTHGFPRILAGVSPAEDVVFESLTPQNGRLRLAGRIKMPPGAGQMAATLSLELEHPDGSAASYPLALSTPYPLPESTAVPLAAARWATLKIADLEADRARNQAAIRRLGKQFGLVTGGASLIVLDDLADYVRYEIEPPAAMRTAYQNAIATLAWKGQEDRQKHLDGVVKRFAERQAWWDKDFPKDEPPKPKPSVNSEPDNDANLTPEEQARRRALAERDRLNRAQVTGSARPMPLGMPARPASPAPAQEATASGKTSAGDGAATITLTPWQSDSAYARRLREAAPQDRYAIYLDERPSYVNSTAFFLDAAGVFLKDGQRELALRVLSNLAEMDLENRQILRILAYRLLQAGEIELALPLLRQVLALSPDEPQSYRDLGLALAAAGQPQQAAQRLWEVVAKPWSSRFPDIDLIALVELNAVIAQAQARGQTVDTADFDPRLMRNLPLGLRAVLAWDTDNTDIDLHVIDPNGEEAYFGHRLTYQGGQISRDATGGYGPEEFALRHPKPGAYTVKAEFYGHRQQILSDATTLMLRLTTGFGTPEQKDRDVVLRLSGSGSTVTVGTFEVK